MEFSNPTAILERQHAIGLTRTPNLAEGAPDTKRQEIARYFTDTFDTYTRLFDCLADDSGYYQKSIPLRHPLIFYLGHTATFFVNKLVLAKILKERINPNMESIFAVGVDEMSWDDLNDDHYDWPAVQEVLDYRAQVRQTVLELIETMPLSLPIDWDSNWWPIVMGIEHERIHLETSSVLIRQLPVNFITQEHDWPICTSAGDAPDNTLIDVPKGNISRNKQACNGTYYGWDNEYGELTAHVNAFRASKFLVSNGEYLTFVRQGGYENDHYWEEEGARWRNFTQAAHPVFWEKQADGAYAYRAMNKVVPLPMDWPVDVNYHEAKAFCNWLSEQSGRTIRLPTENEYFRLLDASDLPGGPVSTNANIGLSRYASSEPVSVNKHGEFYDVVGNVWQWTETPIYPYTRFVVHPLYDDFTTPTFDNKHNLIKGGSWASTGNEANTESRYAFRRHFFQHAGFRYIESSEVITVNDFDYESDTQVSQYCEFHYGDQYFDVDNFARRSAQICLEVMHNKPHHRALDLGCAVGRSSFELAQKFDHVDAIDFSARFIKTAYSMQERGEIRYTLVDEGELTRFNVRRLAELGLDACSNTLFFSQGDACNLKPQFDHYDLIFMGNLLDRVYSPRKLLDVVSSRLNTGGILVIASPFTWLEEYTERKEWLGGFKDNTGESCHSTDALDAALGSAFRRVKAPFDVPFVIRETKRKFQHSLSEFNIFEKVG